MSVPMPLRDDFAAASVRLAAKASKDATQTRRLRAAAPDRYRPAWWYVRADDAG